MKALVEGDKDGIKEGLEYMVSEPIHNGRLGSDYEINYIGNIVSFPAITILKAAWLLGYEIEIDSSLIPMDLMPVRPLEKYEVPYFFLEGYEGELPSSYIEWKEKQADPI